MKAHFNFSTLINLCRLTHQEMQIRAGRSSDNFLAVRNWLFGAGILWNMNKMVQIGPNMEKRH
jgi:hypothetical protein